jgi:CheY-like chemotaxis protein
MMAAEQQSKATVLVVEDEALILQLARLEFEDAGYHVLTAADADAALKLIESDVAIDILFTDIRMPGTVDGWQLAKQARQIRPSIHVIYATGFSADAPQPVDAGVLVTKPYLLNSVIELAASFQRPV